MGAEAFADRARRALLTAGETVRTRSATTLEDLTAQEAQIARLAAAGQTNPEIGAQLFISPRTVEYHLHKVFAKLDIGSRRTSARHCRTRRQPRSRGPCPGTPGTRPGVPTRGMHRGDRGA